MTIFLMCLSETFTWCQRCNKNQFSCIKKLIKQFVKLHKSLQSLLTVHGNTFRNCAFIIGRKGNLKFIALELMRCCYLFSKNQCHSTCGTQKNTHCSMATSAEHRPNFAALHRMKNS